jgi:hypothetical protein
MCMRPGYGRFRRHRILMPPRLTRRDDWAVSVEPWLSRLRVMGRQTPTW